MINLAQSLPAKEVKHGDIDDAATTIQHGALIRSKYFLRRFYENAYAFFIQESSGLPQGERLEIGSGAGFLKDVIPDIITSDVLELPTVDRVFSALDLPFDDETLTAIYMLNTFHHLSDVEQFLREVSRCLRPGGRMIALEPANTPWARFIYQHFHHEPFLPGEKHWLLPPGGPLSMANGALPWIVFHRDRKIFEQRFPRLHIRSISYTSPLLYLLSGGLSLKQLLPNATYPFIQVTEKVLRSLNRYCGMFMGIVIEKQ